MPKKIDVSGLDHYHDKVSAMVADEYSSSATYAVGDYCFHAGTLYKCTTAITTAGAWTSGHWTAAKLAEDTSELKTALSIEHLNLYSGIGNTLERFVNESTGNLQFNASFQTSDYIDVSKYAGKQLVVSYTFSGGFYDASKTYIANSGIGSSESNDVVVTVPANSAYCRISCRNTNKTLMQIGETISRDNYIEYDVIKLQNLNLNNYFEQENLFNKATAIINKYVGPTTGAIGNLTDYYASDWIDIGAENYVTVSSDAWDVVVYNENKTFSRSVERRFNNYPYTTKLTETEKYIRLSVYKTKINNIKVEKNLGESVFVPYGGSLSSKYQEDTAYKQTKVIVGENCYFTTINSALSEITDNTSKNRYTIFVTEGTYNETITTKDYVDIEGESKYKSIIDYVNADEEHSSDYSTIFASTFSEIRNITVKCTGAKYTLHCDARYNEPYDFKAKNCIFQHLGFQIVENRSGTGVGVGLHWGQHVTLESCECIGIGSGSAGIYCHNDNEGTSQGKNRYRSMTVKNCVIDGGTYGVRLQAIETAANSGLQKNGFVYEGNLNNASTPFSLEVTEGGTQSWVVYATINDPQYSS